MGTGLSKPARPLHLLTLTAALPITSLSTMKALESGLSELVHPAVAKKMPDTMKVIGGILFSIGHYFQCLDKRTLDHTDWNYIIGCTPFLTAAFAGNLFNRPLPSQQFLSGLFLSFAYFPLLKRARRANASPLLPLIGLLASFLLMYGGSVGMMLKRKLLSSCPGLSPLGWALATSFTFGTGNSIRLAQLLQQNVPGTPRHVVVGQALKVLASFLLINANAMLKDYHRCLHSKAFSWHSTAVAAALALLHSRQEQLMHLSTSRSTSKLLL
eukprot:TRINITY_DN29117_c0_g1_i1.p1 TRINITY_DN29117_c0_g1~~TRINITY_DN29117_c0_g1_i1.p1  ORF type:complete len:270 (-),score=20.21 TRINITY_DN29117_c0_g1_i1:523-1332(-)